MPYRDARKKRDTDAQRRRDRTASGQDISAQIEAIRNPKRRKKALASFRAFCELYFARRFNKPWSADHLTVIAEMEKIARTGGVLPIAMPRGFGKTSLVEVFCLWCILAGLRDFVLLVGSDKASAVEMLVSIKTELECNPELAEDFPREVGPFLLLEGEARRCSGQRWKGERTHVQWKAQEVVFASVPQSKASGAVLRVAGITGRIRGAQFTKPDRTKVRPSLVVLDDPQTDESAKSESKTETREKIIVGAIKGLAGPGVRLGVVMPCTVIRRGDLADRFLDGKRHPDIRGVRTRLMHAMPADSALKHWEEYRRLYIDSKIAGGDGSTATDYYREHQAAMDEGAEPAWQSNFDPSEISAVQHGMNWCLFNRPGFFCECQNEPEDDTKGSIGISQEMLISKLNSIDRGVVPKPCQMLTAFVDVHDAILYWLVMGWEPDLTGYVVDYGTYPRQPVNYFAQASPPIPMPRPTAGANKEATILAGLNTCSQELLAREFLREDAARMRIGRLLVDSKYETETVKAFCRRSIHANVITPAGGFYLRPEYDWATYFARKEGGQTGFHWRMPPPQGGDRVVLIDTDFWKTLASERLAAALGDRGCWSIFGRSPAEHQLLFEHFCSEKPEWRQSGDRGKWHWQPPPNRPDNHWWDGLIGSAVAASILGAQIPGTVTGPVAVQKGSWFSRQKRRTA